MRAFRFARVLRRFLADGRGAAAVEIGLVAPVMLALVFGMIDFGRAFQVRGDMSRAASAASRAIELDPELSAADIEAAVRARLASYEAARLTVAVTDLTIGAIDYAVIGVTYRFETVFEGVSPVSIDLRVETVAPRIPEP